MLLTPRAAAIAFRLAFALCIGFSLRAVPAQAAVASSHIIYQAFEERFADLRTKLPRLKAAGYDVVQVSPPQKSLPRAEWWARYQPIDYRLIEGPLGDKQELVALFAEGRRLGLRVIVDTVLNHMADSHAFPELNYPQFSPRDFHDAGQRRCIWNFRDRAQVMFFWLCDARAKLPDLDTGSPYVRSVHKVYLKSLLAMGAAGFRFDAVKHIEPEYFRDLLSVVPRDRFWYGEVVGETMEESMTYASSMRMTDFHLLGTMIRAFNIGGDLRSLPFADRNGGALPDDLAVTFSRNHDTIYNDGFFQFANYRDSVLANAFVLSRAAGIAKVFRDDAGEPTVAAAVRFRRAMAGTGEFFRSGREVCAGSPAFQRGIALPCDGPNFLFLERGQQGLFLLNKSGEWLNLNQARFDGLLPGCYRELQYGFTADVSQHGDGSRWITRWGPSNRAGMEIGPRSALHLIRVSAAACAAGLRR